MGLTLGGWGLWRWRQGHQPSGLYQLKLLPNFSMGPHQTFSLCATTSHSSLASRLWPAVSGHPDLGLFIVFISWELLSPETPGGKCSVLLPQWSSVNGTWSNREGRATDHQIPHCPSFWFLKLLCGPIPDLFPLHEHLSWLSACQIIMVLLV
jgi:hypothetical protein